MSSSSMPVPGGIEDAVDKTHPSRSRGTYLETVHSWVTTVDHKKLGILYICYALIFMLAAGVEALVIRLQLAGPNKTVVSPEAYNRIFTMHGTTMIFLVGMFFVFGFGNYLVPLMIGARDMAFPRLNAFSFWISAAAGILLYYSFIGGLGLTGVGTAPDVGWFAYAPLTERAFSPGHPVDYWAVALMVNGIGSIGTAINILATIFCMRCKGMTLLRMPLLTWLYARRFCRPLGSFLLDIWPSGGVHSGAPRIRLCQRNHPGFLAESDLWVSGDGRRQRWHWVHQYGRVGPPHVHHWHDHIWQCVLYAVHHAGLHTHGDQDIQLASDDVGRQDPIPHADALLHRVSLPMGYRAPFCSWSSQRSIIGIRK